MKLITFIAVLAASAYAAPAESEADASILKLNVDNIGVEGYKFDFETSNGITREEQGVLNNIGTDVEEMEIHGSYSYVDTNGKKVLVTFVSDKNGYRSKTSLA